MASESLESKFVSLKQAVEFLDIGDQYPCNKDLFCRYKLNDYRPQEGDRVAIFKLGWSFIKDYVVFEWAPVSSKDDFYSVTFNKLNLPKGSIEIYQFCYVGGENEVHGASSPFTFYAYEGDLHNKSMQSFETLNKSSIQSETPKDLEIRRLKEENALLKQSLRVILGQEQNDCWKNYDSDIKELKSLVHDLNSKLTVHQGEINMLKTKIREGGEEYRKLYLEKMRVEKKYEKLKVKKEEKPTNSCNFDIGDLKSIPPFPSFIK